MIEVVYKKAEKKDCCDFVMLSRAQDDGPQFNQRPQENENVEVYYPQLLQKMYSMP